MPLTFTVFKILFTNLELQTENELASNTILGTVATRVTCFRCN